MVGRTLKEVLAGLPAEERHAIEARTRELIAEEMSLQEVRKAMGKTQAAIARRLRIGQESVSKIESRTDMLISTLRSYLRSIGGDLELRACLPDRPPVRLMLLEDAKPERTHRSARHVASPQAQVAPKTE